MNIYGELSEETAIIWRISDDHYKQKQRFDVQVYLSQCHPFEGTAIALLMGFLQTPRGDWPRNSFCQQETEK